MSRPNFKKGDKVQSNCIKEMGKLIICTVIAGPRNIIQDGFEVAFNGETTYEMTVTDGFRDYDVQCDFCWAV